MTQEAKKGLAGFFGGKDTGFEKALPQGEGYEAYKKNKQQEYLAKGIPFDDREVERMYALDKFKGIIELQKKNFGTPKP
jgi:hypothetical protein